MNAKNPPRTADAMPPINSHIVLSVGDPVKVFDRCEAAEWDASTP
jgi:hypothetical protein